MYHLSSGTTYFADSSSSAGDLSSDFTQAANALSTGNSVLTPDCSPLPAELLTVCGLLLG